MNDDDDDKALADDIQELVDAALDKGLERARVRMILQDLVNDLQDNPTIDPGA